MFSRKTFRQPKPTYTASVCTTSKTDGCSVKSTDEKKMYRYMCCSSNTFLIFKILFQNDYSFCFLFENRQTVLPYPPSIMHHLHSNDALADLVLCIVLCLQRNGEEQHYIILKCVQQKMQCKLNKASPCPTSRTSSFSWVLQQKKNFNLRLRRRLFFIFLKLSPLHTAFRQLKFCATFPLKISRDLSTTILSVKVLSLHVLFCKRLTPRNIL